MEKKLNSHSQLKDVEFMAQCISGTFEPELFTHEAHLRLAWLYIKYLGVHQAEQVFQQLLQTYVESVGAKDKYHKTLTIVSIRIMNQFMQESNSVLFTSFIDEFPQLKFGFKELVNSYYSYDIFKSDRAKVEFEAPDLWTFE